MSNYVKNVYMHVCIVCIYIYIDMYNYIYTHSLMKYHFGRLNRHISSSGMIIRGAGA